jgi:large subunit ribosomal protein L19
MRSIDIAHPEGLRRDLPPFRSGDTVRVHVRIREGEKERIQIFEGVCLRRKRGGPAATFTVRKISYGVGVERVFPIESPSVTKVEIKQRGHVRRSRLYYLRDLSGKKARLRSKVRDLTGLISEEEVDAKSGIAPAAAATEVEPEAADAGEVEAVETQAAAEEAEPAAEQAEVDSSAETLAFDVSMVPGDEDGKSD